MTFDNDIELDIKNLIRVFDNYVDDMFDRGQFDITYNRDREIDTLLERMKKKYLT